MLSVSQTFEVVLEWQDPIEISSDEEVEAEGLKELQADGQPLRRTTRSNAHQSNGVKFKVKLLNLLVKCTYIAFTSSIEESEAKWLLL